jgi:hypothetical protein
MQGRLKSPDGGKPIKLFNMKAQTYFVFYSFVRFWGAIKDSGIIRVTTDAVEKQLPVGVESTFMDDCIKELKTQRVIPADFQPNNFSGSYLQVCPISKDKPYLTIDSRKVLQTPRV